ncbi:MAG: sigma 54-interacting transcriptional regulator, partial [Tissierellaceae bacterium]
DEIGIIRRADGGTLLLDEIAEMDLELQSKLLRFLQEREVRQIGDAISHPVDVRIICITNKDLMKEVESGRFREDLYYRINVINIVVPPLRERKDDLKQLISYFIDKYNISFNKHIKGITDEAFDILSNYSYKGNVRELENIIQRAVLLSTLDYIDTNVLHISPSDINNNSNISTKNYIKVYEGETLKQVEKKLIKFALDTNNQNRRLTAKSLGIAERTLRYKIKEYDL